MTRLPALAAKIGLFLFLASPAPAIIDSNLNGLNDLWEELYNNGALFLPGFASEDDADGDGQSNLAESAAGTDPLSGTSVFSASVARVPATYTTPEGEEDPQLLTPAANVVSWHGV